ncbi:DinB family protein [Nonomuraea sp. NBC_01738]|uniref:DinB family protein n=1 Tax=Nonomuraea sp. NBC_01738 TaxID=2976003 RepID=UPI002E16167F|nr:DinB family protein [Nonomuraea sp. NBC_01738]
MSNERAELLQSLNRHRDFLRGTVADLTEEQARLSPTVSVLQLGGLIKHVAGVEERWGRFAEGGADAMNSVPLDWQGQFKLNDDETLEGTLKHYDKVAAANDEIFAAIDLDSGHELPKEPWFEPGASWSGRRVILHLIAEVSQHAGHADIIRETIDGKKSMG